MPIVKPKWTKRLAVTLCTLLLFCAAIPVTAFADDVHNYNPPFCERHRGGYETP